jgi:UDP-glucose:(heptosyl)LPS alpha-1,3-glucosyltransferase
MGGARVGVFLPKLSEYGGAESFAYRLSGALAGAGFDTSFICARREAEPPEGVHVIEVGRPKSFRSLKVASYAMEAEEARVREKFDVSLSMGKTLRQDLLRASGGPLDVFWRLSKRAWPAGAPRGLKMLRRRASPANMIIRDIERKSLKNSRVIVAVSHLVRDWLIEAHPWLTEKDLRVVYNKPDLSRFSPPDDEEREAARRSLGVKPGRVALGLAGTNFALKGVGTLVRAMAALPEEFTAYVAGGRRPGRFEALAEKLGVAGRVEFLGRVDDMPGFYKALDVFALPSFYDTCSNAVLEALASGVRVVSSGDNGSSFFLPERWVIADPGDAGELARAVESAASEPRPGEFAWPDGVPCGIEPYLELAGELAGGGER